MKNEEYENEQKLAKEILNKIMLNTPTSIKVDFGIKTITETFRDGRINKREISEDKEDYTFEVKTTYEEDEN